MKKQKVMNLAKKVVFPLVLAFLVGFVFTSRVSASEGKVKMEGGGAVCEASSFWNESKYEVSGKCGGLVYPFSTKDDHYYVWAYELERAAWVRVGDIDRGYFEGRVDEDFGRLMVTAETESGPRRPSEKRVMSGEVEKYDFQVGEAEEKIDEKKVSEEKVSATVDESEKEQVKAKDKDDSSGSVVGKIFTAVLAIVVIVIALVVVGSLVFRKRGSVSG